MRTRLIAVIFATAYFGCGAFSPVVTWSENVTNDIFQFSEKASLYSFNCFVEETDDYSVILHEKTGHDIAFDIPYVKFHDNNANSGFASHPVGQYISAMRIFYADTEELRLLLTAIKPNCSDQSYSSGPMLSFSTEHMVLDLAEARLEELSTDEDDSGIFDTAGGEHSVAELKEYLQTLRDSLRFAQFLLRDIESAYIAYCRRYNKARINTDDIMSHYRRQTLTGINKLLEERSDGADGAVGPSDEQQETLFKQILFFANLYLHESVVPFVNGLLAETTGDTRLTATPSVLLDRSVQYSVGGEAVQQRFVVTDRQYERRNYTLLHSSSSEKVAVSSSLRIVFSVDADVDASSLLSNIHGYGAFGLTFMECMELADPATNRSSSSSSSSSSDGVVDGSSSTTEPVDSDESTNSSRTECTAIRTVLSVYNRVVVGPVLALLPPSRLVAHAADRNQRQFDTPLRALLPGSSSAEEVLQRMRLHERSLSQVDGTVCAAAAPYQTDPPRALILGMAAGELHMFLLQHFPCLAVDSVEVSLALFRAAEQSLGLAGGVCRAFTLQNGSVQSLETGFDSSGSERGSDDDDSDACRSTVFISDAWDYISHRVAVNAEAEAASTSEVVRYDLLMLDVYDVRAAGWSGEADTGVSVPFVDRAASDESLGNVRSLLTPGVGLAVFHLHRDKQFQYYYDRILTAFGADQVVLLSVAENDMMVVAGAEGRFVAPAHLADSGVGGGHCRAEDESEEGQCETAVATADDTLPLGGRHPCEKPLEFSESVVHLAEAHQFRQEVALSSRLSLDCRDKREYRQSPM